MKRLLTLTLCLIATASPLKAVADQCDNLRNNQQAYRDCVNDWYGRSNRGSAPTPWWKNYDPNAGSGSAPAEAPTLSKQQLLELQRQQQEADRQAAEAQRKQAQAESDFEFARGRLDWLNQYGLEKLKPEDVLPAFNGGLDYLKKYGEGAFGTERACQLYENTGHALVRLGHMELAEQFFKKSVAINDDSVRRYQKVDEYDVSNYNRSLNTLATFYENQGRLQEAHDIQFRRRDVTHRSVYIRHPEMVKAAKDYNRVQHKLVRSQTREHQPKGLAFYKAGQYAEAVTEFRAVLKLEESLGYNPLREAAAWDAAHYNLGMSLLGLKQFAEAESMLKAALAIREHYDDLKPTLMDYGPREISLRQNLIALPDLYELQQQYTQAEPYLRRIVELQEKTHAPVTETMKSLNRLARNLREQQRYDEAEALYQRGLALAEKSTDKNTSEIATSTRGYLADLRRQRAPSQASEPQAGDWKSHSDEADRSYKAKQYDQAIVQGRAALALAQKNGAAVGASQHNLAVYYMAAKQFKEAEVLFKQTLETFEKSGGPENFWLAKPLFDLATLLDQQKRFADSEALYKRLLAIREKHLSADHSDVLHSLDAIVTNYGHQDRPQEAVPYLKRLLGQQSKKYGPGHIEVARSLLRLAQIHTRQNQPAEAEPLYTRALAIVDKQARKDETLLRDVLSGLAEVYRTTQREDEARRLDQRREKPL